jgi:hypothetical protein
MRLITRAATKRVRSILLATGAALALAIPAADATAASSQGNAYGTSSHPATCSVGYAYCRPSDAGTGHKVG